MTTFTIDQDNNITAYPSATDATECNPELEQFDSEAALAKLSADWPISRFVEIWNSIAGNTEVSKFADRKKAVARVWKAIQPLASDGHASEPEAGKRKGGANPPRRQRAQRKRANRRMRLANRRRTESTRRPR
jgi:hypothetical protein